MHPSSESPSQAASRKRSQLNDRQSTSRRQEHVQEAAAVVAAEAAAAAAEAMMFHFRGNVHRVRCRRSKGKWESRERTTTRIRKTGSFFTPVSCPFSAQREPERKQTAIRVSHTITFVHRSFEAANRRPRREKQLTPVVGSHACLALRTTPSPYPLFRPAPDRSPMTSSPVDRFLNSLKLAQRVLS